MFEEHADKLLVIDIAITINVSLIKISIKDELFHHCISPHAQTLQFLRWRGHPPLSASLLPILGHTPVQSLTGQKRKQI